MTGANRRARMDPVGNDERVLKSAQKYFKRHGYAPSLRDVASEVELTAPGVRRVLERLQKLGVVTWTKGKARSLVIL